MEWLRVRGRRPSVGNGPDGGKLGVGLLGVFAGLVTLDPWFGLEVAGIVSSWENVINGQPPTMTFSAESTARLPTRTPVYGMSNCQLAWDRAGI